MKKQKNSGDKMIVRGITLRNYGAVKEATISFSNHTALIGANGAGKSTILKALQLFYEPTKKPSADDFYGRSTAVPIEIEMIFGDLNAAERELFGSKMREDELRVVRVFAGSGRDDGRYYGSALRYPGFEALRALPAREKTARYNDLLGDPLFSDLIRQTRADEVDAALREWEQKHPDQCVWSLDDGQFFGFQNVGRGNLVKHTNLVFVPAVRDVASDTVDNKDAVVARLMDLVVRAAASQRPDILNFQLQVRERYRELVNEDNLTELDGLSQELTRTLKQLYQDAGIVLNWQAAADLTVPLPKADMELDDDGFRSRPERCGHGLQRALILTLLQHLAAAARGSETESGAEQSGEAAGDAALAESQLPNMILAIEEPELYQHPSKQRHLARTLVALADGTVPGVALKTQVMFATHAPLFVKMERCDEVRLVRRSRDEGSGRIVEVVGVSLDEVARILEKAWDKPLGAYTADGLRTRLHIITPNVCEALFADAAVVAEGESDLAALKAAAETRGMDFEAFGWALISVGGKGNIDKVVAILRQLSIPAYTIWDLDENKPDKGPEINAALMRLFEEDPSGAAEPETLVRGNFACHRDNLEETLAAEIGEQYEILLTEISAEYGVRKKDAKKSPLVVSELVRRASAQGLRSATLDKILDAVSEVRGLTAQ
ncbi:MAG: AAA family ATPase [Parvibaculum sp.]|uniref:ATP-dependent nuclease n=1 Tax=Parvibaculum sp. TaxID=2024848 RepID=UPI0028432401|nr:AAA family ATPase [Parvibaculum sp.]MDR3497838.1 AAA family ATPase [Parvibaculum sp.]